ncbi:DinB family protein [Deinococcus cellulosilyticus]|uniref:DNA damage-inducible protein DinB n=1 Tax=Deinococcus cellulosilyticus (strain DSM 18568 / NBRC 106333 / KACC 11606 / 5516J-15) TaxID=1223518 RepID=A0A511N7A1_DEIC1|nr:DinB family protein [Deinococcus cellulosilyticus]GEM48336.1 DNA damage-inducible protein DinB [Deinococcus cellulosilyticus NBRC 106333 = KACC 11606]
MQIDLNDFYRRVKDTRAIVLNWLDTLPEGVFTREHPDFAFGSLCGIYSHIAKCYLVWVGNVGLGLPRPNLQVTSVAELREVFAQVDQVVQQALERFEGQDGPIHWTDASGEPCTFSRHWLILHPITHEFHHKGQALALARILGHPHPGNPDTDLVAP